MALNGNDLGDAMRAAMDAQAEEDPRDRIENFRAQGRAIVAYFIANAQVIVTSVTGVTPGGGASGAGTGQLT